MAKREKKRWREKKRIVATLDKRRSKTVISASNDEVLSRVSYPYSMTPYDPSSKAQPCNISSNSGTQTSWSCRVKTPVINLLPQPRVTPTELNHIQFNSVGVGSAHVILLWGCWVLEGSREEWWCQRKWGKNTLTFSSNHDLFGGTSSAVMFIRECWVSFVWAWKPGHICSPQWCCYFNTQTHFWERSLSLNF